VRLASLNSVRHSVIHDFDNTSGRWVEEVLWLKVRHTRAGRIVGGGNLGGIFIRSAIYSLPRGGGNVTKSVANSLNSANKSVDNFGLWEAIDFT